MLVLSWLGIIALMASLIPVVAISPFLLYIGMLIGAQAFQETPKNHAPAIILAMMPNLAAWGKLQIDNALAQQAPVLARSDSINWDSQGCSITASKYSAACILGGLMLGAIAAFIIERELVKAAMFAFAASACTFVGLMHGEAIGFAQSLPVAFSYFGVAAPF